MARLRPAARLLRISRRPVFQILSGSVIGQGAVLAVSPALTRLYSPADFAALAAITAISSVLGGLITLTWERATALPRSDVQASAVLFLGVCSTVFLSAILFAAAWWLRAELKEVFRSDVFVEYWWLTPLTVSTISLYALASSWLVRKQEYRGLAIRDGAQGIAQASSAVLLGLLAVTPLGLVSSLFVGRVTGLLGVVAVGSGNGLRRATFADVIATAKRYRKFPLVSTWSRLLNSLGLQLPLLLVVALFGSYEAGLFALTVRVLASPVGIVANAVTQAFEGTFAASLRGSGALLAPLVIRSARNLAIIGALPAATIAATGPILFAWIFGPTWEESGIYAQILILAYFLQFVVSPVSRTLILLEHQGTQFAWDFARAVGASGAVILVAVAGGPFPLAILGLAVVQITSYGVLFVLCLVRARRADRASTVVRARS